MANLVATTVPRANSIRNFLTFVNTIAITVPYVRGKNRPEPQNFGERNSSGVHKRQRIKSNTLRDATLSCHALFFITTIEIIGADPVYPEVTAFGNPLCRNPLCRGSSADTSLSSKNFLWRTGWLGSVVRTVRRRNSEALANLLVGSNSSRPHDTTNTDSGGDNP